MAQRVENFAVARREIDGSPCVVEGPIQIPFGVGNEPGIFVVEDSRVGRIGLAWETVFVGLNGPMDKIERLLVALGGLVWQTIKSDDYIRIGIVRITLSMARSSWAFAVAIVFRASIAGLVVIEFARSMPGRLS